MYVSNKRKGFAMILAIFIIVLVAMGGALILGNASIGAKSIGDNYIRQQAELIALSATEFAVMRAQGFDTTTGNCLNNVVVNVKDASGAAAYTANVNIRYSFIGVAPAACNSLASNTGNHTMILLDTTVTADNNLSTEPIRVVKRTWQKL